MPLFNTAKDSEYKDGMESHLQQLGRPLSYIAENFAKYCKRQELTRFLARHELFAKILNVKGSIIECGVYSGNGLMSWAQLSAILEPMAFWRRVYGFDTFEGFPQVSSSDSSNSKGAEAKPGDISDACYEDLLECVKLFDLNRFLSQFPKVVPIKGDFCQTGERFLKDNPHLVVALLYLDFDLYEPTKKALELFLPRMPKGAILGFDEINNPEWPGETLAMLECLNIRDIAIQKFPYEPNIAYIQL
jgi:hypothetical protein